jgi:hypothetical protein
MCHTIFISTDSDRDLAALPSDQFLFERPSLDQVESVRTTLAHPNLWYLSSKYGGCSCHYRHLLRESISLGFAKPEAWFPEDEGDIESTKAVYDVLFQLVQAGNAVDIVSLWNAELPNEIHRVAVHLHEVNRNEFRFWQGCLFGLKP